MSAAGVLLVTRLARPAFVLLAGGVLVLALYPPLTLPEPQMLLGRADLVNHVAAFFALTALGCAGWRALPPIAAGLAVAALTLEATQAAVPGREPSLLDAAASLAGVALGAALVQAGRQAVRRRAGCAR